MLVSVGVSHKRASLAKLDSLTVRNLDRFYTDLTAIRGINELVVLQTCNRVEIYLEAQQGLSIESVLRTWALATKFKLVDLQRLVEIRTQDAVIEHLVRLATGLESMIIGEPQILGQIKDSLLAVRDHGDKTILSDLFEKVMSAGSKIRAETGIGRGATTIGSVAIRLADETLGGLENLRVLVLGTGQVGVLVMKALKARKVSDVTIAGRNHAKAAAFCRTHGGTPVVFSDVRDRFQDYDLLLVATKSPIFLVDAKNLSEKNRSQKDLMILDLSNPRNVSPDVEKIKGVRLCTIDELKEIAAEGLASRREVVKKAEPLVEKSVERISAALRRENAEPIISDVYHRAEEIRVEELGKATAKLGLTTEQEQILEYMSQRIVEKILNGPVLNLRRAAEKGESSVLTVAGQLFAGE